MLRGPDVTERYILPYPLEEVGTVFSKPFEVLRNVFMFFFINPLVHTGERSYQKQSLMNIHTNAILSMLSVQ